MKKLSPSPLYAPVRLGLCPEHRPRAADRHGEARNDERRQARWFDGHHRHERTKGNIKRDKDGAPAPKDEKK